VVLVDGVLPVGRCFTLQKLRVMVFSRTAIHAPGGWALIENLPHVFTGDRVTVGLTSTYLLPQKLDLLLFARSGVRPQRRDVPLCLGIAVLVDARCEPKWKSDICRAIRDKRGHLA
jgi:hypothetical protein